MSGSDEERFIPNAADEEQIKRERARQRRENRKISRFWAAVLADPIGRAEVWRLLDELGTFRTEFACGPNGFPDANATFYKLGQSTFGMRLYQELLVWDRKGVMQMHDDFDPRFAKRPRQSTQED